MIRMIMTMISAILFNGVIGVVLGGILGFEALPSAIGANVIGVGMSFVPGLDGVVRKGIFTEVFTGQLVKKLRGGMEGTFLDGVPNATGNVQNDGIHLVEVGIDPDVLVNNETYPIEIQKLEDDDILIKLDKFQTKVTPITDDELYGGLSYNKTARVTESHADAIYDAKITKAAHSLTPKQNTPKTPVLKTTGAVDNETKRQKFCTKDLVALKKAMDKLKVPVKGRRLVLCSDHVNDLIETEQRFADQYYKLESGKCGRLYGFDIYEYAENPIFTKEGIKKELKAQAAEGEFQCSFAFYDKRVFKADGSSKTYPTPADALHQRNLFSARHYAIVMHKKMDAATAIYSGYVKGGAASGGSDGLSD